MTGSEKDASSRHLVAIVFALLSGVSAVSTAVLPAFADRRSFVALYSVP